jgi:sulfopyruvate decarboxylase alpha subunit
MDRAQAQDWPRDIFEALEALAVRQVAYVPDAGHKELLARCAAARAMRMVPLTTEEEGVALLAGAWLGGERGVLLMQSSGIGNCVNLFSLARVCRFPLLMLVTMRGEAGEFNPWQVPMGENAAEILRLAGVRLTRVEAPEEVGAAVAAAGRTAFEGSMAAAVLLAQRLVGVKSFAQ